MDPSNSRVPADRIRSRECLPEAGGQASPTVGTGGRPRRGESLRSQPGTAGVPYDQGLEVRESLSAGTIPRYRDASRPGSARSAALPYSASTIGFRK